MLMLADLSGSDNMFVSIVRNFLGKRTSQISFVKFEKNSELKLNSSEFGLFTIAHNDQKVYSL